MFRWDYFDFRPFERSPSVGSATFCNSCKSPSHLASNAEVFQNDCVYDPTKFLEDILTKYSDAHTVLTRLKIEVKESAKHVQGYRHHKINSETLKKLDDLSHLMFMEEMIALKEDCWRINSKIAEIEQALWHLDLIETPEEYEAMVERLRNNSLATVEDSVPDMANKALPAVNKLLFKCKCRFTLNLIFLMVFAVVGVGGLVFVVSRLFHLNL